jgi:hypothetical protein
LEAVCVVKIVRHVCVVAVHSCFAAVARSSTVVEAELVEACAIDDVVDVVDDVVDDVFVAPPLVLTVPVDAELSERRKM